MFKFVSKKLIIDSILRTMIRYFET